MRTLASNYAHLHSAQEAFLTFRRELHEVTPDEIVQNRLTRIRTVSLCFVGDIIIERRGIAGEIHQFSVWAAGCTTSLSIFDGVRPILVFPVLQTGSFKLEAAFMDGLSFYISSNVDAPPHITVNWRATGPNGVAECRS